MALPKLPNFGSDFVVTLGWASGSRTEPPNKLFVYYAEDFIPRLAIAKPRQNGARLRLILTLVHLKIDAGWVMTKQDRGGGIE